VSIDQEIKDQQVFGYALKEENRRLIKQMMSELDPKALDSSNLAKDSFEVVAIVLIFNQQKIIRELMGRIKNLGS
jgi:hypothetical protein